MTENAAILFYKIGHYRQAAMLMADAVLANQNSLSAWCGLGSSLAKLAMGRSSYAELAAQAFKKCLSLPNQGDYHSVATDWINSLTQEFPSTKHQLAMDAAKVETLFELLDVDPMLFPNAMAFIEEKDRMFVVMTVGDLKKKRYLPILIKAIELAWDEGCTRAALKRIVQFESSPEILAALSKLNQHKDAENFNPYLSHAIKTFGTAEKTNKNETNEVRATRVSDSNIIIQPLKSNTMSVLQKSSEVIEKGIESLGIPAATTRGQQPGQWDFKRGSVSVAVGVTISERFPNGYFYVNSILMDAATVPANRKEEFYKRMLDLNPSLVNMKLAMSQTYVMLLSNRDANGLDPEEVASTINELSYYADLLDDQLKEGFK